MPAGTRLQYRWDLANALSIAEGMGAVQTIRKAASDEGMMR
jgi:hypothetical protein